MVLYSVEAVALRGPCRVCMIDTEISNTFLESSDIVLSLVPDQKWYLKVDQISPTLKFSLHHTLGLQIQINYEQIFHLETSIITDDWKIWKYESSGIAIKSFGVVLYNQGTYICKQMEILIGNIE